MRVCVSCVTFVEMTNNIDHKRRKWGRRQQGPFASATAEGGVQRSVLGSCLFSPTTEDILE